MKVIKFTTFFQINSTCPVFPALSSVNSHHHCDPTAVPVSLSHVKVPAGQKQSKA